MPWHLQLAFSEQPSAAIGGEYDIGQPCCMDDVAERAMAADVAASALYDTTTFSIIITTLIALGRSRRGIGRNIELF